MTNELVQQDGSYNPDYIEWMTDSIVYSSFSLSRILWGDVDEDGRMRIDFSKVATLILDVQQYVHNLVDERHVLEGVLEHHNHLRAFLKKRNLEDDFQKFLLTDVYKINSKS